MIPESSQPGVPVLRPDLEGGMSGGPRCLRALWDRPRALVGPGVVGLSLLALLPLGATPFTRPVAPKCFAASRPHKCWHIVAVAEGFSSWGVGAALPRGFLLGRELLAPHK